MRWTINFYPISCNYMRDRDRETDRETDRSWTGRVTRHLADIEPTTWDSQCTWERNIWSASWRSSHRPSDTHTYDLQTWQDRSPPYRTRWLCRTACWSDWRSQQLNRRVITHTVLHTYSSHSDNLFRIIFTGLHYKCHIWNYAYTTECHGINNSNSFAFLITSICSLILNRSDKHKLHITHHISDITYKHVYYTTLQAVHHYCNSNIDSDFHGMTNK